MKNYDVDNYISDVLRSENKDYEGMKKRLNDTRVVRLLHGGMGISTEAGEFLDMLKKHIFYGKGLDEINLMEEIGDVLYYTALCLDVLGYDFNEVMEINIQKLKSRYPDKFTKKEALNRDLGVEREILENVKIKRGST